MTYIVRTLIQESPQHTVGPVIDPETSAKTHDDAGLPVLAEKADKRAKASLYYEALDRKDVDNWRRALSYTYPLWQFSNPDLPAPVVATLAQARDEQLFERIEVWTRYHWKSRSQEVVFVGIIGEYPKPTDYYVIAQWSPVEEDVLTTGEALRLRHRAQTNPLVAYSILPLKAKIAFAIFGSLFTLAVINSSWELALASTVGSGISWISGKLLAEGDDELAELVYVGMALLAIVSIVLTVVLGAAA